ncbi:pyridoxal phosphate-dependent aminotransferase [Pseudobdellovibrio exovorus]|uniref:Aspartate aminotransferase n=1 Tax=Pseudobdellovibrio exovorus JSS TaxID=1184267 RepID=M4VCS4_9BACT|nr:pyridoxal phosphate-dependent aminotransferase [Pseudobdellovibrio exovorus]AGH96290.1 aspartate aminotransferase [Pseudobdellovibrio exovorus JSS]
MLSQKAQSLKTSPTLFLVAKARELQSQGHDVISLTVGEPDWATYPAASEAGIEAIRKGMTKYTPANGTVELRKAIVERIKSDLGQSYAINEVAVTSGAKFAIFAALQVLCDPQDEVIIHSPYWVSYPTMVELSGGKPVLVTCTEETNFKITADLLRKHITPKTKAFLFCSPSNPTGFVYSREELAALAEVLKENPRVAVITDDMYNRLMFDGSHCAPHILQVAPELRERTIIINGGSKAYSMTGWRIGWALGPQKVIQALGDYASQSTGAPSSISQHAAVQAITNCEANIRETNQVLKDRLVAAMHEFKTLPQFKVFEPQGAFYLWVDVRAALGRSFNGQAVQSSKDFCQILLEKFFVATVPGEEFGNPGFMRLSFAIDSKRMAEAIRRMRDLVNQMA